MKTCDISKLVGGTFHGLDSRDISDLFADGTLEADNIIYFSKTPGSVDAARQVCQVLDEINGTKELTYMGFYDERNDEGIVVLFYCSSQEAVNRINKIHALIKREWRG